MRKIFHYIDLSFSSTLSLLVKLYQFTISPLFGSNCRFQPTCSQYAIDALNKKPFYKAIPLIIVRVLKCHPFHSGGYDPVK